MSDDRTMEKIRGLLAKAEHPTTPDAERDTARELAERLMVKHAIDQAMLADTGTVTDTLTTRVVNLPAPYARQKLGLLGAVAEAHTVTAVGHRGGAGYGEGMTATIVGYTGDVDRVEVLFTSLLLQASREVMRQTPPTRYNLYSGGRRRCENVATYRISWLIGFINAVRDRLTAAVRNGRQEADQQSHGRGTELVLRDRKQAVDAYTAELFPTTRHTPTRSSGSGGAQGYAAGQRADIGETRVGSNRPARPTLPC